MKKTVGMLTVAALGLWITGCGKDKELNSNAVAAPELMRTWEGGCESSDILDLSLRTYYKLDGADYKEVHTFYAEKDCRGEAAEVSYSGVLAAKDKAPNGTRSIDFRFDRVAVMATGPAGKQALEKAKLCGVETWELGKPVDLAGKTGTFGCPLRKVPTGEYNIISVENEVMYLGKSGLRGGATVESDRPTTVDHDKPFRPSQRQL